MREVGVGCDDVRTLADAEGGPIIRSCSEEVDADYYSVIEYICSVIEYVLHLHLS